MVLTFTDPSMCRLCRSDFDAMKGGPMYIGERTIPRVVRRYVLPMVCDRCWGDFEQWRRGVVASERRGTDKFTGPISWEQENARIDSRCGQFSDYLIEKWLAEGLAAEVRFKAKISGDLAACENHIQDRRAKVRRRIMRHDEKGVRRMIQRYDPFPVPWHAQIEAER